MVKILTTSKKIYVREGAKVTTYATTGSSGSDVIIYPTVAAAKAILGALSCQKGGTKK